jgi:hypothetical protein
MLFGFFIESVGKLSEPRFTELKRLAGLKAQAAFFYRA